jgi:putative DNA methylase
MDSSKSGWRTRGYLPHLEAGQITQFITLRLYDSLPAAALAHLMARLTEIPEEQRSAYTRARIHKWLDSGYGSCMLRHPDVAEVVQSALQYFHPTRYQLLSWCIMPNHLHLLVEIDQPISLGRMMHSLKSFSAKEANRVLGRQGPFWYPEYFDRYIRSAQHQETVVNYIHENPVRAGLCSSAAEWRFSSARAGINPGDSCLNPHGSFGIQRTRAE